MTARASQDAVAYWRQFRTVYNFDKPGDAIAGVLVEHGVDGPPKDPIPKLLIQTKDGYLRTVLATQERLKTALQDACPAIGDGLRITYLGEADKAAPGMSKAKLFNVEIRRAGSQPAVGTDNVHTSENGPQAGNQ